jgi:Tol biopolymer transport system component
VKQAWWQPDGASISYLHSDPGGRTSIREVEYGTGKELSAAQTSRYVHFAPNADGSVFVGASGSLASPDILLLHRKTRRELTLCEHACRDAALASPVFSPDSRRVYFTGDVGGNAAIRSVDVSRLVEET